VKALIALAVPLALFYGGYVTGQLRKQRAVARTYGEVQPVLTALRRLLDTDVLATPNEYLLRQTEAREALASFEREVRGM
jgi:hypothetical protein